MILHVEICDVCLRVNRGGLPMEAFSSGSHRWDVGPCCQSERFTVVKNADVVRNQLSARVEALVSSELDLLKKASA